MRCYELVAKIEELHPGATARDVARLCMLLTLNFEDNLGQLADSASLVKASEEVSLRLDSAWEQHAAMTQELDRLWQITGTTLDQEQVWTLVRALRVQSQLLRMYVGAPR